MERHSTSLTVGDHEKEVNDWIRFGMRLGVSAALHPFEYSKVLIQLGYEPIAPRPGTSVFTKRIMFLPNIFQYAGYIRRMDGFFGMYRGLTPKLVGSVVGMLCSEKIADRLGLPAEQDEQNEQNDKKETKLTEEQMFEQFKKNLKRDVVLSFSGLIVSHPFHVISVRMMAQFVGKESVYKSIIGSIREIYRTEGISGFFSGLIPKVLCDVACLILTSSTVYVVSKYVIDDTVIRSYFAGGTQFCLVQFVFASILYPLQVVSTCMIVTGSRIMAGGPPVMPEYSGWIDCWFDLKARGELKRGSSLFWRSSAPVGGRFKKSSYFDMAPLPTLSKYA